MSGQTFDSTLTLFVGAVLVCAVAVLWLAPVRAVVRVLAVQGLALGAVAATLGLHVHDAGLVATAGGRGGGQGGAHPGVAAAHRVGRRPPRETPVGQRPRLARRLRRLDPARLRLHPRLTHVVGTHAGSLVPVGFATLLIGFFVLVARRRPIFQIVGLLLVDNGIVLVAFLVTAGVPFLIELGVTLDVLLGVVVLMVLAQRLQHEFGEIDLDELQELHD